MIILRRILALLAIAAFATPLIGMATTVVTSATAGHCAQSEAPDAGHMPTCDHGIPASCDAMTSCASVPALEMAVQVSDDPAPDSAPLVMTAQLPTRAPRAPETPPPRA